MPFAPAKIIGRSNSDADPLLLKAVFGPQEQIHKNYEAWRQQIIVALPFAPSTYELLPYLQNRLKSAGIEDDLTGRLAGICRKVWAESRIAIEEILVLVSALEKGGVRTMLDGRLIGALTSPSRTKFDIHDPAVVVVEKDNAQKAVTLLVGLGWRARPWLQNVDLVEQDGLVLYNEKWRPLELRWRYFPGQLDKALDAGVWTRASRVNVGGTQAYVPSASDVCLKTMVQPEIVPDSEILMASSSLPSPKEWDRIASSVLGMRAALCALPRMRRAAEIMEVAELEEAINLLQSNRRTLLERVEDRMGQWRDSPWRNRVKRAAGYVARRLREKSTSSVFDLLSAVLAYAAYRLSREDARPSTIPVRLEGVSSVSQPVETLKDVV